MRSNEDVVTGSRFHIEYSVYIRAVHFSIIPPLMISDTPQKSKSQRVKQGEVARKFAKMPEANGIAWNVDPDDDVDEPGESVSGNSSNNVSLRAQDFSSTFHLFLKYDA